MSLQHRFPLVALMVVVAVAAAACSATSSSPAAPTPERSVAVRSTPAATGASEAPSDPSDPAPSVTATTAAPEDALLAVVLTDVRSGETFTLGDLAADEGPVLVEPMAVWCSNCRAQQHEVKKAHEGGASFTSVSLDVDLSEAPEDLAAYADREGFDWRFAMADAALYRLLQERFGIGATNPPLTPLIVVEADGTVRPLEFGVGTRGVDQLISEIEAG